MEFYRLLDLLELNWKRVIVTGIEWMHWHKNMNGMISIPLWKFNSKALVTVHCIVVALGIFIVCGHLKRHYHSARTHARNIHVP